MSAAHHDNFSDSHIESQKRQRIRDLSQYYCVTRSDNFVTINSSDDVATWTPRPPTLAADPILTTLTQTAALVLGVERCLVSIIDDQHQHVIAEATRSVSPFDINQHDEGDEVLLGAQSLPFNWGVCSSVFSNFVNGTSTSLSQPGNICSSSGILIGDLLVEDRSCFIPVVVQNPKRLRFYAGAPLFSTAGRCIGVVCVFDPAPRAARVADLEKLQQSAAVIARYLAVMRLSMDTSRAERLLDGMANFIRDTEGADVEHVAPVTQMTRLSHEEHGSVLPASHPEDSQTSTLLPTREHITSASNATSSTSSGIPETTGRIAKSSDGVSTKPPEIVAGSEAIADLSQNQSVGTSATDLESVFTRASRLIRECLDLDGACFLTIPHKHRFHAVKRAAAANMATEPQSQVSTTDVGITTDSSLDNITSIVESRTIPAVSDCLGLSIATHHTADDHLAQQQRAAMPSSLLTRLAMYYARGHIFHFDESGGVSSGDEQSRTGGKIADQVFGHFGHARSLMFLPLYDHVGQHAYASFVGWTNDPKRSLQERERLYVSGFAHSIMSEITRQQSQALDNIKSEFITSISHELRSPLHGVLAAHQLLSESTMSREQNELVTTVGHCATTLLDVLNQLFDHAKITAFGQSRRPRRGTRRRIQQTKDRRVDQLPLAKIRLLPLLEETVTSLDSHGLHLNSLVSELDLSLTDDGRRVSLVNDPPFLTVDADVTTNQQFRSHSGLWRTIIMNLLGNAIKFTNGGHVHVALRILEPTDGSLDVRIAELSVHDTGRGMSEHFLRHRCFEPYAQEDNLSAGTGLGLSIVHRAVMLLRGTIMIDSKLGIGTDVVVRVPMKIVPKDEWDKSLSGVSKEADFAAYRATKFNIGSTMARDQEQPPTANVPPRRTLTWSRIQETLTSTMTQWFGMQHVSLEHASLVLIDFPTFQAQRGTYDLAGLDVLIVIHAHTDRLSEETYRANIGIIRSPLNPRVLVAALQKLAEQKIANESKNSHGVDVITVRDATTNIQSPLQRSSVSDMGTVKPKAGISPSTLSRSANQAPRPSGARTALSSSTQPTSSLTTNNTPEKKLILLVDDNELNLRILTIMVKKLEKHGFEAITASDGQQALDRFVNSVDNNRKIPFVFMDITMPVMDGMEATRRIREYEKSKGIPKASRACIVAVTGLASAKDKKDVLNSGCNTFIQKPANLNALRQILFEGSEPTHAHSI